MIHDVSSGLQKARPWPPDHERAVRLSGEVLLPALR
jgi:hypothetical protein